MTSIYDSDLLFTLPKVLADDQDFKTLAEVIADELKRLVSAISRVVIYPDIENVPERVLDILAVDLHIDWYDLAFSVSVKRRLIKNSVKVHRYLGTKYAVETALSDVFPESKVAQWFEYGGEPFYFKVDINTGSGVTTTELESVMKSINYYKNLRSHLDDLNLKAENNEAYIYHASVLSADIYVDVMPSDGEK